MSETRGFDLDGETSRAWSAFTRRLADRLADMADGETLTLGLGAPSDDSEMGMARILFVVQPEGTLCRTEYSPDDRVISKHVTRQRDADQLATETVSLLKQSHGILHPAFLSVTGESYEVQVDDDLLEAVDARAVDPQTFDPQTFDPQTFDPQAFDPQAFDPRAAEELAEPIDSSHLLELAFAAITHDLGREPIRDIDGDLVVESGSTRVFVRVLDRAPVIQLFSRVVHNVTESEAAPGVVSGLNNDYPFVKFLFGDNAVLASVHLPAAPFVPAQLRHMLAIFSELVDELDDQLAGRLGGEREIERVEESEDSYEDQPDGVPPELMILVRLDPDGRGLDPEETATVCGYDRGLTRQLLHIAAGQEEVWLEAGRENLDDPDQVARCAEEAAGWEATRRSLTGALELIDSLEV